MNLKNKIIILAVIILSVSGAYFLYRRAHPRYVPLPPRPEVTLTIIPGWNLRQVADYFVNQGLASSTTEVYDQTGKPAVIIGYAGSRNPPQYGLEGYLEPETARVFKDALLSEILEKFIVLRKEALSKFGYEGDRLQPVAGLASKNWHEILTMASLVEKEVKHDADRPIVADILWRRVKRGWALQVDSSVHYAIDKTGTVYTTDKERAIDSPWNTYKYPGLPPGPICNPGLESIKAALNPEPNDYWYFLSGRDGKIYYAKTLEDHNRNKKYL